MAEGGKGRAGVAGTDPTAGSGRMAETRALLLGGREAREEAVVAMRRAVGGLGYG